MTVSLIFLNQALWFVTVSLTFIFQTQVMTVLFYSITKQWGEVMWLDVPKGKDKKKNEKLTSDHSTGQELTTPSSASHDLDYDHGIDKDVLEMKFEDGFRELDGKAVPQYSKQYLLKSREILMSKVEHYRQQLDQYELEKRRMALETRKM